MSEVEIVRVVEVFEANRAQWALVGAHRCEPLVIRPASIVPYLPSLGMGAPG